MQEVSKSGDLSCVVRVIIQLLVIHAHILLETLKFPTTPPATRLLLVVPSCSHDALQRTMSLLLTLPHLSHTHSGAAGPGAGSSCAGFRTMKRSFKVGRTRRPRTPHHAVRQLPFDAALVRLRCVYENMFIYWCINTHTHTPDPLGCFQYEGKKENILLLQ